MKRNILVLLFFIGLSVSSFAYQMETEIQDYIKRKRDSIEAIPSLTEEQKLKMILESMIGPKKPQTETQSGNNTPTESNSNVIEQNDNSEGFNLDDFLNNLNENYQNSELFEIMMNSMTLPDEEFGPMIAKINVIDTVVKKFSCSGGNIVGEGNSQVDSNLLFIYWSFGLPRKGIYTSCKGGTTMEVDYFGRTVIPVNSVFDCITPLPKITDSIVRYADKRKTKLIVMDVLTGENIFEKNVEAAKTKSVSAIVSQIKKENMEISMESESPSLPDGYTYSEYKTIDIRNIPPGLYFIAILDEVGDVAYIKTYNKEK
ncbi:MAG: hypothetical protein FWG85_01895 [Bacteroidetes bacterium]|nr:hypothetical protein [Bacteroidota bacterium]